MAAYPGPTISMVEQICVKRWSAHKSDCSAFVKAVAADLGLTLRGQANDIVDQIQSAPWTALPTGSGKLAEAKAEEGHLVIGGLKATPHGHVVVVVQGPLNRDRYPTAYWGSLRGVGKEKTTLNYAWVENERDLVQYGYVKIDYRNLSELLTEAHPAGAAALRTP